MSPKDATEPAPEVAASPAIARKLGLALLVIATAQLMLVLDDVRVTRRCTPAWPTCRTWPASGWPPAGSGRGAPAPGPPGPSSRPGGSFSPADRPGSAWR